ncbi:hypothetical protein [Halomarina oriensis]|uniref:Uncharacterized protein n=1 Tax=Halomarina oriensis TaxID=671145 RepID=A0A6B0GK66_9EURY|nr:hypothetical protein [Halomarina oriensis]MWG35000.1 hypothetical protein [Halomarina oriensis]
MPAVWTYPWNLTSDGLAETCEGLAARGVDALTLASHYHSIRSLDPRHPDELFTAYPGGCYFDPDPGRFADMPIDPLPNEVSGLDDPVAETVEAAADHGLGVNAWTVCLHNSRLGAANPSYRVESAFGDAHDHALCPSNPEVREYFAAVVEALVDRGVAEVHLESVGFGSPFHEHGWRWGHPKRQALTGTTEEVLLAQCFCEGCRTAATDHPIDLGRAQRVVRDLVREWLAVPAADAPPLDAVVADEPVLDDLFAFRSAVVESFVARLAEAAGSVPLSYYVMEGHLGADPTGLWPAGVRPDRLADHLDRAMAICYVSAPDRARDRIRSLRETVDGDVTVDAGVTLDPNVVPDEATFDSLVEAVRSDVDGAVSVYHHGLMTDTHLDWLASTFGR